MVNEDECQNMRIYGEGQGKTTLDKEKRRVLKLRSLMMDGRLAILRPFNSISGISGLWVDDDERLYAMETCLRLRRFRLDNPGPLDQLAST